jgi:hypothetical protein
MKLFTLFLLCICACAVYADVDEDKQNVAQVLRETTSVIPLEVNAPTYPLKALQRGIEGWVVLRFVVKEDGTTDDIEATLRHVERALVIADDVASNPIYIHLLRQAIVDNGRANNYQASLKHYEILLETDKKLAPDDPVHDYIKRVKQALNSDAPILSMGEVSHSCKTCEDTVGFWRHVLNRNHFYVDQVVGQLSEITIVCQNSSVTVGFSPETAWTVNKDGGDCSVKVFGEKETTFRLVELANQI